MSVTVTGVPELLQRFATLSARSQKGVMRAALRSAARPVVNKAKQIVPVRTGALKRGIQQRVSVTSRVAEASIGYDRKQFYGRFIELGTSKMSAKPFLRPALDGSQNEIESAFLNAWSNAVEQKSAGDEGE